MAFRFLRSTGIGSRLIDIPRRRRAAHRRRRSWDDPPPSATAVLIAPAPTAPASECELTRPSPPTAGALRAPPRPWRPLLTALRSGLAIVPIIRPEAETRTTMNAESTAFDKWMQDVDRAVYRIAGLSAYDLADFDFADDYADGMTPDQAARRALKRKGFPVSPYS